MEMIRKTALVLTIIGALNWGLIGLFNLNLVTTFIKSALINNIIYIVIVIASLVCITNLFQEKTTH